jgi:hypothetical protein
MTNSIILPKEAKAIPNHNGYYAHPDGYILSKKRKCIKILVPEITKNGYMRVVLSNDGKTKRYLLHRLIAFVFLENGENKCTINHVDGNKGNNNINNLEWATYSENHLHAYKKLGRKPNINQLGNFNEKSALSKRVFQFSKDGILIKDYPSVNEAGRQNPQIDSKSISAACLGKIKSCGGYVWSYNYKQLEKEITQ